MRDELKRLVEVDRVQLISSGVTTSDERIKALDQRIFHLNNNLQSAVIVPSPETSDGQIRFGATVTVREQTGEETRYRIVGIDEADIDRGWISWLSPLAKKLINARPGDRVHLSSSGTANDLEILAVTYE
jgi:transcription elongation factor GreB